MAYRKDDGSSFRPGSDTNRQHVSPTERYELSTIQREPFGRSGDVAYSECAQWRESSIRGQADESAGRFADGEPDVAFAPGPDPRWPSILRERPDLAPALELSVRRVADGLSDWTHGAIEAAMSNRTKRLGRLGNAVVPDCVEWVGERIMEFDRKGDH